MNFLADDRDLLSDNGLDEMQKTYAYKLAFKCFKALFWSVFAVSMIMILLAVEVESMIFSVAALVIEIVDCIIYVIFGAKASKVGAMNPKFAQNMAKPSVIIGYFSMAIIYAIMYIKNFMRANDFHYIFLGIYLLIFCGHFVALGFISKKNNKVIEETEED